MTAAPPLSEFERIARFFAPLAREGALDLRDDVAVIDGPGGSQYVLTTDAIVAGVDYFPDDPPHQVAQKLLRVNLSDLAAKGAVPFGYLLVTCLPVSFGDAWIEDFAAGLAEDQKRFGIGLLGGDSSATPGPATFSLTAIGQVAKGKAVLRGGAGAGDLVFVSGTLGDAALGLETLKSGGGALAKAEADFLIDRYRLPQPRLALGQALAGIATAMTDISDGLVADLGHIADASSLAAVVECARLPLSAAASKALQSDEKLVNLVLGGGDDYELVFTSPSSRGAKIASLAQSAGVPITAIGRIEAGAGVRVLDRAGRAMKVERAGYTHF